MGVMKWEGCYCYNICYRGYTQQIIVPAITKRRTIFCHRFFFAEQNFVFCGNFRGTENEKVTMKNVTLRSNSAK